MRKRFLVPALVSAAGLAMAFRRSGIEKDGRLDALRPSGADRSLAQSQGEPGHGKPDQRNLDHGKPDYGKPNQGGRGRDAAAPQDIPPRGWWEVIKRTASQFSENQLTSEAAAITFFALLSLFPAITAVVSIYGIFADPSNIQAHLDGVAGFVPSGGMEIVRDQVKRLTQSPASGLSLGAAAGILAALWSANQGAKAMLSALNDVYGEREQRGFVRLTATSLAFTIGGILALFVGLGLAFVLPLVFETVGLSSLADLVIRVVRWPLVLAGLMAGLSLLYRYGPSRHRARWQWVTWGGAIAAIGWVALSYGFSWYVANFGNYNKTYGSLGAAIGFMTWIWLSSTVLLLGAQINAELETQTARDTTTGGGRALGSRGAAAADSVA